LETADDRQRARISSEAEPQTSQAVEKTQTPMFKRQKGRMNQLQLGTGTMNFFGVWIPGVWSFFADSENLI
jgi:hypothetical protein